MNNTDNLLYITRSIYTNSHTTTVEELISSSSRMIVRNEVDDLRELSHFCWRTVQTRYWTFIPSRIPHRGDTLPISATEPRTSAHRNIQWIARESSNVACLTCCERKKNLLSSSSVLCKTDFPSFNSILSLREVLRPCCNLERYGREVLLFLVFKGSYWVYSELYVTCFVWVFLCWTRRMQVMSPNMLELWENI